MAESRLWHPPSLCGCSLNITADWASEMPKDGIQYQHPIPWTVTNIEIVSACIRHRGLRIPDTSNLFDDGVQNRGYIEVRDEHTPAEILYLNLYEYTTNTETLICGCVLVKSIDRAGNHLAYHDHPHHSKKCHSHKGDSLDGSKARADHERTVQLLNEASVQ